MLYNLEITMNPYFNACILIFVHDLKFAPKLSCLQNICPHNSSVSTCSLIGQFDTLSGECIIYEDISKVMYRKINMSSREGIYS